MRKAKKVLGVPVSKHHYAADACVVWCFDDRFTVLWNWFLKERGFRHVDLVKIAGGAKSLAENGPGRDFVLGQVKASVALHKSPLAILMLHKDCGAYGGSKAFLEATDEERKLTSDFEAARDFLIAEIPGIVVECVLADFNSLYTVE